MRLFWTHTPRSRSLLICSKFDDSLYVVLSGVNFLVMCWAVHFLPLNERPDSDDQTRRLSRSFCRWSQSFLVLMVENSFVSSANIAT